MTLLHASYLEQLRGMREEAFTHTVTFTRTEQIRLPSGEYVDGPTVVTVVPGLLARPSEAMRSIAATSGTAVDWVLKLRVNERADIGDVAVVEGETDGMLWTRTVEITGDLGLVGKVNKRLSAIDSDVNVGD